MALLCTLHADGPATLKRLRQAGCATLEGLERLEAERVAQLLGCTPAAARRLQREARGLRERLHGEVAGEPAREAHAPAHERASAGESAPRAPLASAAAEPAPRAPLPSARAERAGPPSAPDVAHEPAPAPEAGDAREAHSAARPGESLGAELPAREQRLLQRVVDAWKQRDATEPASAPPAEPASNARFTRPRAAASPAELADVPPAELGTPLRPDDLDGLDAELTARLSSVGVGSLEALARADAVALSHRLPAGGFTRLARLIALARRALPPAPASTPRAAAQPFAGVESARMSPAELPFALQRPTPALDLPDGLKNGPPPPPKERFTRSDTEREGAGGPFV